MADLTPLEHQLFEKIHEVNDRGIRMEQSIEYIKESIERSNRMHKEHYDFMKESTERRGLIDSRLVEVKEMAKGTAAELREHKEDHKWTAGFLLSAAAAVGGAVAWALDKFGGRHGG